MSAWWIECRLKFFCSPKNSFVSRITFFRIKNSNFSAAKIALFVRNNYFVATNISFWHEMFRVSATINIFWQQMLNFILHYKSLFNEFYGLKRGKLVTRKGLNYLLPEKKICWQKNIDWCWNMVYLMPVNNCCGQEDYFCWWKESFLLPRITIFDAIQSNSVEIKISLSTKRIESIKYTQRFHSLERAYQLKLKWILISCHRHKRTHTDRRCSEMHVDATALSPHRRVYIYIRHEIGAH